MNYRRNEDKWPYWEGSVNYNNIVGEEKTESGTEPVTLDEAKKHIKVTFTDDDSYITLLIKAAREAVENFTGLSLIEKDIVLTVENVKNGFDLPYGPVTGDVTAVNSDEVDVEGITYITGQVRFDGFNDFHAGNAVFTYSAGYTPEDIPASLKLAILEEVAFRYEKRGDVPEIGPIAKGYAKQYKRKSWLL